MSHATYAAATIAVAPVLDQRLGGEFTGTKAEAVEAVLTWAAEARAHHGDDNTARTRLARMLVNSQHDRVAEMFAAVLLTHLDCAAKTAQPSGDVAIIPDGIDLGAECGACGWTMRNVALSTDAGWAAARIIADDHVCDQG
jgi:hypothetical protein